MGPFCAVMHPLLSACKLREVHNKQVNTDGCLIPLFSLAFLFSVCTLNLWCASRWIFPAIFCTHRGGNIPPSTTTNRALKRGTGQTMNDSKIRSVWWLVRQLVIWYLKLPMQCWLAQTFWCPHIHRVWKDAGTVIDIGRCNMFSVCFFVGRGGGGQ